MKGEGYPNMMSYDFVAIDFETATNHYDSACSIGIAAVKNGEIVDTFYSLLKPPGLNFLGENIAIHGITPDAVKHSPTLDDIWPDIEHYFKSNLVVAHNAYFDISVLNQSLNDYSVPNFKFIDSISIAKGYVPGSKSLANCCEYLNIDIGQHHNALDDAIACAQITILCLKQSLLPNIGSLCFACDNIKISAFSDISEGNIYKSYKKADRHKETSYSHVRIKDMIPSNDNFDKTHPLYSKYIVFTGQMSIGRKEAMQLAIDMGAILKDDISKKVHYLVVGQKDPEFTNEDGLSRKEQKAMELNHLGKACIQIISEAEFMALVKQEALV